MRCRLERRSQFFEAVQLNPQDPVATPIVARMDELFAVDAEARRKSLSVGVRHVRRQERPKCLLDEIRGRIEAAQSVALPASALSKACQYVLKLWRKLTRFLEYPELELSNNLAENSMRPVALGRNWIHIGSSQAGPKVAAILSVVESCRRFKLRVRDYLAAVLPRFADLSLFLVPLRGRGGGQGVCGGCRLGFLGVSVFILFVCFFFVPPFFFFPNRYGAGAPLPGVGGPPPGVNLSESAPSPPLALL